MSRPAAVPEPSAKRVPRTRSAISNGTRLLEGVSRGSAGGRRFRDLIDDLSAEIGGSPSQAEVLQIRTIAGLIVHVEQLQSAMLNGEPVDSEQLTRVSNSAARLIGSLKARQRKPKSGRASVAAYLAEKRAAAA